ncbi:MAG TPA: hypothetical protein VGE97_08945 [Nitrososphaera sp.]
MTGWNMPPGCNVSDIPGYDDDGPCAVCCKDVTDCICPECQTCGEQGNPKCYSTHGLKLSREQAISRQEVRLHEAMLRAAEEEQLLEYLKTGGNFSDDLADNPDPWR